MWNSQIVFTILSTIILVTNHIVLIIINHIMTWEFPNPNNAKTWIAYSARLIKKSEVINNNKESQLLVHIAMLVCLLTRIEYYSIQTHTSPYKFIQNKDRIVLLLAFHTSITVFVVFVYTCGQEKLHTIKNVIEIYGSAYKCQVVNY